MMFLLDSKLFVILGSKQNIFHKNIRNAMLDQTSSSSSAMFCLWKWYQETVYGRTLGLYFRGFKTFLIVAQIDIELALQYHTHPHTYVFLYI